MAKTTKYKTGNFQEHSLLLTEMHTYSQHNPARLVEISFHQIPSQRGIYKLREKKLSSIYYLAGVAISHITAGDEDFYVSFTGKSRRERESAKRKLENLTNINLASLEEIANG